MTDSMALMGGSILWRLAFRKMTGLGLSTWGRRSTARNMPWNEHSLRFGSICVTLWAPREFLKSINFSVLDVCSCSTLVTLSSTTLPKRMSLQCGSDRLTLRTSRRPIASFSASPTCLSHPVSSYRVLGMPECSFYPPWE